MDIIDLTFVQKRKLFSLPVLLMKEVKHMMVPPYEKSERCNAIMYVDTGSNLTSITELEAEKLNLNMSALKHIKVGGIGGFIDTPMTSEVKIYLSSSSGYKLVKLD